MTPIDPKEPETHPPLLRQVALRPAWPAGQRRRTPMLRILGCTTLVLAVVAVAPSVASGRPVKQSLRPTGVDPNAQGVAMASIHAKRDRGKFRVSGRNLKPGTTYGISVAGVRIGSLTTRATGSGAARFSSPQHGSDQFLGVDPRGKKVEVSDDQGEDVLENEMPDDGEDQGSVQCCLPDEEDEDEGERQPGPPECEQLTTAHCAEEGGTVSSAASCEPNPCVSSPSGAFLN